MSRTLAFASAVILTAFLRVGLLCAETKTAIGLKGGLNLAVMTGDMSGALPPDAETDRNPIVRGVAFPTASEMKIDARADSSGTKLRHDSYYSDNIYNTTSPIFEGAVGIGLDWQLGGNTMTFEVRYTRSIGAVLDDIDFGQVPEDDTALAFDPSGEAFKLAHNVFAFIIGYAFSL